ncbi:hypothetical protein B0O99DRAFT_663584 [Bisporella sp. PMI_857]|nr:hypothetical protein B0O99DRAFT_663584 [Bisporella sp. PMI_857]
MGWGSRDPAFASPCFKLQAPRAALFISTGILASFVGALTASLSVLLTIGYGVVASRFNLLKEPAARDISKTCVRLFLPALLITIVGSELHYDTAFRYIPILKNMGLGWLLKRAFSFPAWTIPALCFNNTTAMPLLLFLISSIVGNSLTFAVGPRLLDDEEAPDQKDEAGGDEEDGNGDEHPEGEEEHAQSTNSSGRTADEQEDHDSETTTLLPRHVARHRDDHTRSQGETYWRRLPGWLHKASETLGEFMDAPIIGAIVGRRVFKAWLASSLQNIGDLFAALQLVIVGAKLSGSLVKMKKGEDSGSLPTIPVVTPLAVRFIVWPALSIGGEAEKMAMSKFIALAYVISLVICLAVVGSLKAALAVR